MPITIEIPEPVDGVDFYSDETLEFTVSIEVVGVTGQAGLSEERVCSLAIAGFRDGLLDGDAVVVHSEKICDNEWDLKTGSRFDRDAWRKAKLLELGLNERGDPLRPGEKERPECETKLSDFIDEHGSVFARIVARIDAWGDRYRQAFLEAF